MTAMPSMMSQQSFLDWDELALQPQRFCRHSLQLRYGRGGDVDLLSVQQCAAQVLASTEQDSVAWYARFLSAQQQGFIPSGRVLSGVLDTLHQTAISCFVLPVCRDSGGDGHATAGLEMALTDAVLTMGAGARVGYDFSSIDPSHHGSELEETEVGGVVRVLRQFAQVSRLMGAQGREAQMAMLRCDHPDIEAFLLERVYGGRGGFRSAIGVSDAFMHAVQAGMDIDLTPPRARNGTDWGRRDARALWASILLCAYERAEPGLCFVDRMRAHDNLSYCESISASSPLGEQPLPPYGGGCLGSIDLTRCVLNPFTSEAEWDVPRLRSLVPVAVRMLDNVLDLTLWPLEAQRQEAMHTRRIGLGVTGLADALVMLGLRYGSVASCQSAAGVVSLIRDLAYGASCALAKEKGAFAALDVSAYLAEPHAASRLPESLKDEIRRSGLRNSHLMAIAPARSISVACADNTSPGISPPDQLEGMQYLTSEDGSQGAYQLINHVLRLLRQLPLSQSGRYLRLLEQSQEVEPEEQLVMVGALTPFVDGGIAKTLTIGPAVSFQRFQALAWQAWSSGLKSVHFGASAPA
ncbi:MAG: ribonucleoside-diphosphate reductase, adenosylcobalamin-dependent [Aquabacterium sp.]|uniref:ribonucleoside-diphosphate reductase, adenosylcobalamin-dependent n=1 Tax=Aquabacterium sp. TaxID=1872578 RepID=UPI003BC4BEA5